MLLWAVNSDRKLPPHMCMNLSERKAHRNTILPIFTFCHILLLFRNKQIYVWPILSTFHLHMVKKILFRKYTTVFIVRHIFLLKLCASALSAQLWTQIITQCHLLCKWHHGETLLPLRFAAAAVRPHRTAPTCEHAHTCTDMHTHSHTQGQW